MRTPKHPHDMVIIKKNPCESTKNPKYKPYFFILSRPKMYFNYT